MKLRARSYCVYQLLRLFGRLVPLIVYLNFCSPRPCNDSYVTAR